MQRPRAISMGRGRGRGKEKKATRQRQRQARGRMGALDHSRARALHLHCRVSQGKGEGRPVQGQSSIIIHRCANARQAARRDATKENKKRGKPRDERNLAVFGLACKKFCENVLHF